MRDDAARELEGGIGGVIRIRLIDLAVLVAALRNMGSAEAAHGFDRAEEIVEHVAPMRHHIEDYAAAIGFAIVPGRALRRLPVALEHPIAEFAAHREDAAEEAAVAQHGDFAQTGEVELVLHDAAFHATVAASCATSRDSCSVSLIGFSQ